MLLPENPGFCNRLRDTATNCELNELNVSSEVSIAMDIMDTIKKQIEENDIILYMKGSPNAPQCGFSMRASQAIMACGQRFAYVDVLTNPDIRTHLPKYANWPTFPQLWVKGELVGGCDIITEMHERGELKPLIDAAVPTGEAKSS